VFFCHFIENIKEKGKELQTIIKLLYKITIMFQEEIKRGKKRNMLRVKQEGK
jgi:hypothetical protein